MTTLLSWRKTTTQPPSRSTTTTNPLPQSTTPTTIKQQVQQPPSSGIPLPPPTLQEHDHHRRTHLEQVHVHRMRSVNMKESPNCYTFLVMSQSQMQWLNSLFLKNKSCSLPCIELFKRKSDQISQPVTSKAYPAATCRCSLCMHRKRNCSCTFRHRQKW